MFLGRCGRSNSTLGTLMRAHNLPIRCPFIGEDEVGKFYMDSLGELEIACARDKSRWTVINIWHS